MPDPTGQALIENGGTAQVTTPTTIDDVRTDAPPESGRLLTGDTLQL